MNTETTNAVDIAGLKAQYDERAKRLLDNKTILSHIMIRAINEFKGMTPKQAEECIEGEPIIGEVLSEPGLTNSDNII